MLHEKLPHRPACSQIPSQILCPPKTFEIVYTIIPPLYKQPRFQCLPYPFPKLEAPIHDVQAQILRHLHVCLPSSPQHRVPRRCLFALSSSNKQPDSHQEAQAETSPNTPTSPPAKPSTQHANGALPRSEDRAGLRAAEAGPAAERRAQAGRSISRQQQREQPGRRCPRR